MSTKHYVDGNGKYLGGFGDGAKPKEANATRIRIAPKRGDDIWNGSAWVSAAPKPTKYTHTRRQFRMLLTDAQEAEIKAVFQVLPKGKVKRALRIWWADETSYKLDDREMQKILTLVSPATAAAIEAAWIK